MKTELNMPDPSVDWRAVARMVEQRDDLRKDITMVVEPDQLRFLDDEKREVRSVSAWNTQSISDLDTTLSLLDWIEEQFSLRAS
jgi:hypothetical protein